MDGTDFDLADWAHLPPLEDADLPAEPPPEREFTGGVMLGSEVASVLFAGSGTPDLGAAVCQGLAAAQPGLVEIARLGSTGFDSLNAIERVDALIAVDRQESWLAACKQELLASIAIKDCSVERWCVEEVGAALRLSGGVARTGAGRCRAADPPVAGHVDRVVGGAAEHRAGECDHPRFLPVTG